MTQKTLTSALVAASLAASCTPLAADIRIEAVGVANTHLQRCPGQKAISFKKFYQYKVFAHFSLLTLGQTAAAKQAAPLLRANDQPTPVATQKTMAWNRLTLKAGYHHTPLDIFKSSHQGLATTGSVLTTYSPNLIADWSKTVSTPVLSISGNTSNPSGRVVLCVDFIPCAPVPHGELILNQNPPRTGENTPMSWKINR